MGKGRERERDGEGAKEKNRDLERKREKRKERREISNDGRTSVSNKKIRSEQERNSYPLWTKGSNFFRLPDTVVQNLELGTNF